MMTKNTLLAEDIEALRSRDALIGRWGEHTMQIFDERIGRRGNLQPSDLLCITTLTVCSTYFSSIMILLKNGMRMPAKALLRVLFEVSVKTMWCLHKPGPDKSDSAVEQRIERWAKASLKEDIRLRQDFASILEGEDREKLEEDIRQLNEQHKAWECERMPSKFTDIVKDLGDVWFKEHYPRLYRQFNSAVHLDFASLCSRAKYNDSDMLITNDTDEAVKDLAQMAVAIMHVLFGAIRLHYRCPVEEMNQEFAALT